MGKYSSILQLKEVSSTQKRRILRRLAYFG